MGFRKERPSEEQKRLVGDKMEGKLSPPPPSCALPTGDFAMLLQAGLSFRRLLLLSLVSGALGLGGAALGVGLSLGPVPLTPWVFGVTAGVFLYVALVDMVRDVG